MQALTNLPKTNINPEGTWTIAGAKTLNGTPYSGTVQIQPMGKIYTMSWLTTLGDYSGMAFLEDNYLFAGCGFDESYGVTLYKINPDGTLDGKWTVPLNKGAVDWEKAINDTPGELEGSYQINGFSAKIGSYEGTLNIRQLGDTYEVSWSVGVEYKGIGLRVNDWLIVCWGAGDLFSFVYEIKGKKAQGRWAVIEQTEIAEEVLEKIC